jgi:hypothetical protein
MKKTKTGYSTEQRGSDQLAVDYKLPQLIIDYRTLQAEIPPMWMHLLELALLGRGPRPYHFNQR